MLLPWPGGWLQGSLPFDSDHTVQHVFRQPNPEKQGPADPGGCEVSGHRHHLVIGVEMGIPLGFCEFLGPFASFAQAVVSGRGRWLLSHRAGKVVYLTPALSCSSNP